MDKDLDLNTSGDLPKGDSLQGATSNSMGGFSAADCEKGYGPGTQMPQPGQFDGSGPNVTPDILGLDGDAAAGNRGFLNRPEGWER